VQLIEIFLQIFLLRKGPEDVPNSMPLLVVLLGISATIKVVLLNLNDVPFAWLIALFSYAWLAAFVLICLAFRRLLPRFVQTFTTLLAVELISLLLVKLLLWLFPAVGFSVLGIILMLWTWLVLSNILRQALNVGPFTAVFITVTFETVSIMVYQLLWAQA
jgi:hypothetical protein